MSRQQVQLVNIVMNVFLGIALSVVGTIALAPGPVAWGAGATWEGLILGFVKSFCIGYTVGDIVPSIVWGMKLGVVLGAKPGTWANYLVQCVVMALVMVTLIGALMLLTGAGFAGFWPAVTQAYLPLLGAGFVLILVFLKPV
ncbi:MAG TPA: hypothetical protein VHA75_18685, partial [Rugosimonospora sp.]|nr:hypothetical protein [Rugosimonospora sp.]